MPNKVAADQLLLIRIDGMHCHRCEEMIRRSLAKHAGVHEVEVDFPSGQASVLFDQSCLDADRLVESVQQAGYRIAGSTLLHANEPSKA